MKFPQSKSVLFSKVQVLMRINIPSCFTSVGKRLQTPRTLGQRRLVRVLWVARMTFVLLKIRDVSNSVI